MLKNLAIRWKVILLPCFAAVGFLLLLAVNFALGRREEGQLGLIEAGFVPSLELSRDLEETLTALQRQLQDAVAAQDAEALNGAGALQGPLPPAARGREGQPRRRPRRAGEARSARSRSTGRWRARSATG